MMNKLVYILIVCITTQAFGQNRFLRDGTNNETVPYATISFGNGNGLFADDEGGFYFTKKLYPDIDTLFITALGYKEKKVPTANLEEKIFMVPEVNHLKEVVVKTKVSGKFKIKQRDPVVHDDYFHCWLPTIESEIAVFFDHKEEGPQKISKLYLPIKSEASDWNKRKSSKTSKKPFSTLFKVNFYENNDGLPGESLISEEIVFIVNEKNKKGIFQLNLDDKDIFVPRSGIFVSIQILGYTDKQGKLLPNKKYKEVKTKRGIVKVSTTFRPLLPFTNKIASKKTYVKRIFLNSGKWVRFERKNIQKNNKLLQQGYNNYGMGLELKVYNKQKE